MNEIQARIEYPYSTSAKPWDFKTNLKKWLSKDLEFSEIEHAELFIISRTIDDFTDSMVLATVAFDKHNTIYILMPKAAFSTPSKE